MASVWHMGFEFSEPRDRSLLSPGILDAVADAVDSMGSEATVVVMADDETGECRAVTFSAEFRSSTGVMDEDMHGDYWFKITFDE